MACASGERHLAADVSSGKLSLFSRGMAESLWLQRGLAVAHISYSLEAGQDPLLLVLPLRLSTQRLLKVEALTLAVHSQEFSRPCNPPRRAGSNIQQRSHTPETEQAQAEAAETASGLQVSSHRPPWPQAA